MHANLHIGMAFFEKLNMEEIEVEDNFPSYLCFPCLILPKNFIFFPKALNCLTPFHFCLSTTIVAKAYLFH